MLNGDMDIILEISERNEEINEIIGEKIDEKNCWLESSDINIPFLRSNNNNNIPVKKN